MCVTVPQLEAPPHPRSPLLSQVHTSEGRKFLRSALFDFQVSQTLIDSVPTWSYLRKSLSRYNRVVVVVVVVVAAGTCSKASEDLKTHFAAAS